MLAYISQSLFALAVQTVNIGSCLFTFTIAGLDTLESRCDQLTERFFRRSVLPETSCLHYLLPDKRDASVTDRLRHARNF